MAAASEEVHKFHHVSGPCNKFSNKFYSALASETKGNIISSPLSAHVILALVAQGARGVTAKELKAGLSLPETSGLMHDGFKSLLSTLNQVEQVDLSLANTIYIQEEISLVPDFLSISSDFFLSDTPRVNFKNNVAATKQINAWVEEKTKNKIKDLISADDIDEDTKVVLVNAIYFKGHWANQFNSRFTENKVFHVTKDINKNVPMMFRKGKYPNAELPDLQANVIEIPYLNENFSMVIVLPNEIDGLSSLEENFDWEKIENAELRTREVELSLPRFKIETTIDLENKLRKIGMNLMFSDKADFSGITEVPLKVGKVLQKAFIEVNEEGAEAAAATVVHMVLRMAVFPEIFNVDRPFLFAIQHKPSKIPLFIGSVRDIEVLPEKDEL